MAALLPAHPFPRHLFLDFVFPPTDAPVRSRSRRARLVIDHRVTVSVPATSTDTDADFRAREFRTCNEIVQFLQEYVGLFVQMGRRVRNARRGRSGGAGVAKDWSWSGGTIPGTIGGLPPDAYFPESMDCDAEFLVRVVNCVAAGTVLKDPLLRRM